MKRFGKFAVVFLCISIHLSAVTQMKYERGTIVVVYPSQDGAIIAADSRKGKRDDDCKIATFSNKIIIASSGFRSLDVDVRNVRFHWDSHDVAHRAFVAANSAQLPSNQEFVTAVASKWAELAVNFFQPVAAHNPSGLIQAVKAHRNFICEMIFVGRDRSGKIIAVLSQTYLDMSRSATNPTVAKTIETLPPNRLMAMGENAIVLEFASPVSTMSGRAKKEVAEFERSIARETPQRKLELQIIQFAKWTIAYGPTDVGGDVDAIRFDNTGIHWIQKKQICKDQ